MKGWTVLGGVMLSVLLSASASAACGGGGYNPQKSKSATTAVSTTSSSSVSNSSPVGFDASYFHTISGQLHMSGEQATNVIKALGEIRSKLNETPAPKDFDPKKEFEKRLATILNSQQMKTFQDATKAS